MSILLVGLALDSDLPARLKLPMIALCNRASDDTDECYPSMNNLARQCGNVDRRTARQYISELVELGLVIRVARTAEFGRQTSNLYRINRTKLVESYRGEHMTLPVSEQAHLPGLTARSDLETSLETSKEPSGSSLGAAIAKEWTSNIGIMTERSSDLIKSFIDEYPKTPVEWVGEAFSEAVAQNARRWAYVRAILERWATDGRQARFDSPKRVRGSGGKTGNATGRNTGRTAADIAAAKAGNDG